jgi:hypothetical protein
MRTITIRSTPATLHLFRMSGAFTEARKVEYSSRTRAADYPFASGSSLASAGSTSSSRSLTVAHP